MPCVSAGVLTRIARNAEARVNPAWLQAMRDWTHSDCGTPDRKPSRGIAPNWDGTGRCGACAACRPEQRTPSGDWDTWLYCAGRGAGKTRSAAEAVAEAVATNRKWRIAILAPTYADARDTCVEGESGLLAVFERWGWEDGTDFVWNRSLGELIVYRTKCRIKLFSAEKPARLRGPQHHLIWVDELAQVVRDAPDAWDMAMFGLRLGKHPRAICTTTPLPVTLIKDLLVDPRCAVTRGRTDDNRNNLPAVTLRALHKKYDGTRLGRQELDAELLDDIPGALWQRAQIDADRIFLVGVPDTPTFDDEHRLRTPERPVAIMAAFEALGITIVRVVIAMDPAVTSGEDADETGITVVAKGLTVNGDEQLFVLDDCSLRDTPDNQMERVIAAYDLYQANDVIVEVNNGGEYIPSMLRKTLKLKGRSPASIPCRSIRAKKGKRVRAEPVSALYEQRQVHHLGTLPHTEDQICTWTPEKIESPDRMDSLVYGVLYLSGITTGSTLVTPKGTLPRHQGSRGGRAAMPTSSVRRTA